MHKFNRVRQVASLCRHDIELVGLGGKIKYCLIAYGHGISFPECTMCTSSRRPAC